MNSNQRLILTAYMKQLLKSGEDGDFVNIYNFSIELMKDMAQTDPKLKSSLQEVISDFENPE